MTSEPAARGRAAASGGDASREAWFRRAARVAGGAALALVLASCGVGGALAVSAGGGGGGGGGSGPPPVPTSTIVLEKVDGLKVGAEINPASNFVKIQFQFAHVAAQTVNVTPQFQTPGDGRGHEWKNMTIVAIKGGDPTVGLVLDRKRKTPYVAFWNSLVDLPRPSDGSPTVFTLNVRVVFTSGDAASVDNADNRIQPFFVDYHLAAAVASEEIKPAPGRASVPCGLKLVPDGLLVACAQSDIVEHVDSSAKPKRVIGWGAFLPAGTPEPGVSDIYDEDTTIANAAVKKVVTAATGDPAAVRPRGLLGLTADAVGNVVTVNHYYLALARFGSLPSIRVPPCTEMIVSPPSAPGGPPTKRGPACCRRPAFHPSGALLYSDTTQRGIETIRNRIMALNPQDPAAPGGTVVTIAGVEIMPGECKPIYDTSDESAPPQARIHDLAVGPWGEVYFDERREDGSNFRNDYVIAFNPTPGMIQVGAVQVPPLKAASVAGPYHLDNRKDTRDVAIWDVTTDEQDNEIRFLSIAVSQTQHVLFVASPTIAHQSVYAVDLEPSRVPSPTFAGVSIPRAAAGVLGAPLICDAKDPACPNSRQFEFDAAAPINAIEVNDDGDQLFVAHYRYVTLINGGANPLTAYGKGPILSGSHEKIYDGTDQFGIPISHPRGVAARGEDLVFFSDDRVIRALNLSSAPVSVAGTRVSEGTDEVVAGAAAAGFSGDGGPAISARFDAPAAMVASGGNSLYVADTGNDRIRLIQIGDPANSDPLAAFGKVIRPGFVDTVAGGGPEGQIDDGDDGLPTAASLAKPQGVALRLSDRVVFVADTGHDRIRAMNPNSSDLMIAGTLVAANSIKTIVGHGVDGAAAPGTTSGPTALAVAGELLFFAEVGTHRIRAVNLSDGPVMLESGALTIPPGEILTICGTGDPGNDGDGGLATAAKIDAPAGLAVARDERGGSLALYFSDGARNVVRMVNLSDADLFPRTDPSGSPDTRFPLAPGQIATVNAPGAGSPARQSGIGSTDPTKMLLSMPWGVVVVERTDSLNHTPAAASVLVADGNNDRLVRFPVARPK